MVQAFWTHFDCLANQKTVNDRHVHCFMWRGTSDSYKRRRQTRRMSPINITMVFLTVTMYSLSTTHIALSLHQNLIAFFEQHAADGGLTILNDQGSPLVYK